MKKGERKSSAKEKETETERSNPVAGLVRTFQGGILGTEVECSNLQKHRQTTGKPWKAEIEPIHTRVGASGNSFSGEEEKRREEAYSFKVKPKLLRLVGRV